MEKKVTSEGFVSVEEYNFDWCASQSKQLSVSSAIFFTLEMWLEIEMYQLTNLKTLRHVFRSFSADSNISKTCFFIPVC